jgi:ribonuclease HI
VRVTEQMSLWDEPTTTPPPAAPRAAPARKVRRGPMVAAPGARAVYTDGACAGNPGRGGWAWAIDRETFASGAAAVTTNQRMEVQAALEAVTALDGPLLVVSDSTYVVNCFRDAWWDGWLRRDWTNSQKKPVANRDLWEPFVHLVNDRGDVAFQWVKGHSGHAMNDFVDGLAVAARLGS